MYSKDKSAVKINNKMTEAFPCYIGVKQGCMLSPTLFNLYLSDLPEFLNSSSSTDILFDDSERPINCLLYADDLLIFSRSANGLQTLLNKLESYCDKTELTVNLDKIKVMTFNNCGKSLSNSLRNADAFPVVASLPPKSSVCEPERQNDFRDVKPFVLM